MMTFSLRPSRRSLAPLIAASVSTRVVSWKEAAARNDEVLSDALVTPSSTVSAVAGSPPSARTRLLISSNSNLSTSSNGSCSAVARLVDAHLAQHLPDDDLDVLVVDGHALAAVHALDFLDEVALHGIAAARLEVLLRVDRAVGDRITGADRLAVLDQQLGVVRDGVLALDDVLAADAQPVVGAAPPGRGPDARTSSTCAVLASWRATTWLASTRSPSATSSSWPFADPQRACRTPRGW